MFTFYILHAPGFVREEIHEYQDKLIDIHQKLLEDETGRKLLKEMPGDVKTQIEALKKKGIACVELGDPGKAMKCFEKAKELEEKEASEITRKVVIE